jgi:hypothetical protein
MRLRVVVFNKEALLGTPPQELSLFLALAHVTNEVNALLRLALWTCDFSYSNETQVHGQLTLCYTILRLLAGKLNEGFVLLEKGYFGSGISKSYDPDLLPPVREAMRSLKDYFTRTNLIHEIRNKFSFHYDAHEIAQALPRVDEDLIAYFQVNGNANNLYYLAEVIASTAAVTATSSPDLPSALSAFTNDLNKISYSFSVAADGIIAEFIRRYAHTGLASQQPDIDIEGLQPTLDIRVPWFTDPSEIDQAAA